jgi:hypothetical protein
MAKISSPWVGISKGKLGEGVYYHANGKQLARARNRQPANPRTDKQAVQRMVLASASKALAALRPLYDHSAEGVQVGQQSIFYWQRKLTQGFRAAAAAGIDLTTDAGPVADFAIKGAPMIAVYDGMPLTEGRLTMRPITSVTNGALAISITGELAQTITSQAEYEAELAKIGIQPGDQLTFVYIAENTSQPVATFGNETDFAGIARYARVTFVSEIPANFSGSLIVVNNLVGSFNPALIAKSEGTWPAMVSDESELQFETVTPAGFIVQAATIVRSQLQTNGKTWYNSAKFVRDDNNFDENDASGTYPSYMDNAEGIDVGSPLYLKNAIVSPN